MNPIERTLRALDRFQQRHRVPGLVVGVVKKYGDDRGGLLAALITYYGFVALIPLLLISALLNATVCLACFRVLTPKEVPVRALWPGCALAGPLFTLLQAFGALLVTHELRHAGQVYGFFATVIGLLSWLYLAAQITVYAADTNVVLARRLWPRSILQPPLTDADEEVLSSVARQEERRPEQHVDVSFHDEDGGEGVAGAEGDDDRPSGPGT
ncbi:virulence factor BrkB [Kitasatospora sp. Ki12]